MTLNKNPFNNDNDRQAEACGYVVAPDGGEEAVAVPSAPYEDEVGVAVAMSLREVDVPTATQVIPTDDALAEAAAAEARQQGVNLIRDHLDSYLDQNPDASYVTWIATLHPENAEVTIDPRFMIPGNPWATVFAEAQAAAWYGASDTSSASGTITTVGDHQPTVIPSDQQDQPAKPPQPSSPSHPAPQHSLGGLIPMIIGFSILLSATSVAVSLQLVSTMLYIFAVICGTICHILPTFGLLTAPLYIIPGFLLVLFQGLDWFLLLLDTVLVELLALLCYVLTTPLAFSHNVGVFYHQITRRLPHYVRWACRKPFEGFTTPPRAAFWCCKRRAEARFHQVAVDEA